MLLFVYFHFEASNICFDSILKHASIPSYFPLKFHDDTKQEISCEYMI